MQKGFKRNFEPIKILTDSQIEQLHYSSLQILNELGFKYDSEKALKLLGEHGCSIDYETRVAKIPPGLVEWAIRKTPSSFMVKARDPEKSIRFGGNTLYFFYGAGARYSNIDTGEVSLPTIQQNNEGVIIGDALNSVHAYGSYTPYFEIEGVPPVMSCPVSCAQRFRYSTKPSRGVQCTDNYIWEIQIAQVCDSDLIGCVEGAAPLSLPEDACKAAFHYLNAGFPIHIASGSVMGASHPITIAGATVSHNAELLAIVVLLHCIKAGCGIIANNFVSSMNMQTGDLNFGTSAVALHQMAYNQIWRSYYEIPTNNCGATFSNSKMIDYQLGAEKLPVAICQALSGANLIPLHGALTAELAFSPVLAVIDDDVANTIGRIVESFEVSDDLIDLDVIKKVGNSGTFLNTQQTRTLWKKENYTTRLFDKSSYQEWLKSGKKTIITRAKERMEEILVTHKPVPLSVDQDREINKILKEAEDYYKKKGLI